MSETSISQIYRILIRDLVIKCSIGVHDYERLAPQRIRINVEMTVREQANRRTDDIAGVVSYEDIINMIKALVTGEHINLVETLAAMIARACLQESKVEAVKLRVEKLDVYAEAASVGVEIERTRGPSPLSA